MGGRALWSVDRGVSPIIGTAIHNGGHVREETLELMALAYDERLREEDPFTDMVIRDVPNRVVFHRSRFEIDLNRERDGAVYLTPEQAWGLKVWRVAPPSQIVEGSLRVHDAYYAMLRQMLSGIEADHGRFVLLDIHSYNHRRAGPDGPPTNPEAAPDINIGTSSMDRARWAHIVDPFIDALRAFVFCGRRLDVRENVAFQGRGEQTRFVHENFPTTGCAIAIEFKKFFMDEWTGEPDLEALAAMRAMITATLPLLEGRLLTVP
nr:N-formylglutamate amidohydrolase [Mesorhizobium sp. AR07]